MAIQNRDAPELTRRVILGFEQHSVTVAEDRKTAVARWCNKEFGIFRDYRLLSELGGRIWTIDFTGEQLEELVPAAFAWFRRQREVADGRIYAYPPDWTHARAAETCGCEK